MKRLLFILCILTSSYAFAEKRYLLVWFEGATVGYPPTAYLYGDIPSGLSPECRGTLFGIKKTESNDDEYFPRFKLALFNLLAEKGYIVESFVNAYGQVLFSRTIVPQNSTSNISKVSSEEPTEVARYNLQGLPVTEFEKGVQIIVYSNYTTKTILVQ